jgi:hypothetical protein
LHSQSRQSQNEREEREFFHNSFNLFILPERLQSITML